MTQDKADPGRRVDDAIDRLNQDWLAVLLRQLIRAAGLLQPDHHVSGDRVSLSQWFALGELAQGAPLTQRDLAERLGLDKSTVSRLVAGLEGRGLVIRGRDPDNRRFNQVAISQRGHAVLNQLAADMLERHARISAAMRPAEREALATGLAALVRAMGDAPPGGAPVATANHLGPTSTAAGDCSWPETGSHHRYCP